MKYWHSQLNMAEVTRAFRHIFATCAAHESSVDGPEFRVIEPLLAWTLFLLVLAKELESCGITIQIPLTMVSGYSIWTTLMFLISSGDSKPNWTS